MRTLNQFAIQALPQTAVAFALIASSATAFAALPSFTFTPAAAGLASATPVTADNIIVSDFSTVSLSGSTFTETGYLSFQTFQLGGAAVSTALNSTYGLYIAFSGHGTSSGNFSSPLTTGSFTDLSYTMYGYNGSPFSFSAGGPAPAGSIALASGSLISGGVVTTNDSSGFIPSAHANLTFQVAAGEAGFFTSPVPFYGVALTSFTNTTSQVTLTSPTSFSINQGGGAINFAAPVPEPSTHALLIAGLAAGGFISRARRR